MRPESKDFDVKEETSQMGSKYVWTWGFSVIGAQEPYFHLTYEEWARDSRGKWDIVACGVPEVVRNPNLRALNKWHLSSVTNGPMHYLENGKYWWEYALGARVADQYLMARYPGLSSADVGRKLFDSTVVFGAVHGDEKLSPSASVGEVVDWMKERKQKLMAAMLNDFQMYGGDQLVKQMDEAMRYWYTVK